MLGVIKLLARLTIASKCKCWSTQPNFTIMAALQQHNSMQLGTRRQRAAIRSRQPCCTTQAVLAHMKPKQQVRSTDNLKKLALVTAVKTPYLANGKFDLQAYDSLIVHQIEQGVEGVIVGGTTGEGQLMSWDEHIMLIAHTVNNFGHQLAVIGNTGSNSTREALHATEQGFAVGMHAALQINPYYGKTSKAGLLTHFNAVLNEGPAIIYNVPGRTGQDIPNDVVYEIAQHSNFLGMKECTGLKRIADYTARGVNCWSGNDDEAHDSRHSCGAAGVISVTSNMIPGLMKALMDKPNAELNASVRDLMAWMFCEPNPISLNTAMAMCGLAKPVFRLPYVPLNKAQREQGAVLLRAVQQHIPGCKEVRVMEDHEFVLVGRH